MAKKPRDTPTQKRDEDQRATTDSATSTLSERGDLSKVDIQGAPPQLDPSVGPSTLRPDLAPGVDARAAGFQEIDRKGLDAQMAQKTQPFVDPLGQTITKRSGPGVDEMLKKAGLHGLKAPGVQDLLPPESKGTAPDLLPAHNPSLYADGETTLKEYVPPAGAQEKAEKLAADEQAARQARADQAEARKAFEKRQYEDPKKMTNPDADPGGGSPIRGIDTPPPVFQGDWVSHPVQGDGSGGETPTRVEDPFKARGGVVPGVVDKNPDYVETKIEGPPRVPQSQFTDGVNPNDNLTSGGPTGGGAPPHTGGESGATVATDVPAAALAHDGLAPDAVVVTHDVPAGLDTGGPPAAFDGGDAPAGFDAGDAPAPSVSVDHQGMDFGGPPPGAEDVDAGAPPGDLDDDGP